MPKKDTNNSDDLEQSDSDYDELDPEDDLDADDDDLDADDDDELDPEDGEPECPYCDGSKDKCKHLLAIIDITFDECRGGYLYGKYGKFFYLVADKFEETLRLKHDVQFAGFDDYLDELWETAKEQSVNN